MDCSFTSNRKKCDIKLAPFCDALISLQINSSSYCLLLCKCYFTAQISFNLGVTSQVNETTNNPRATVTTTPGTN